MRQHDSSPFQRTPRRLGDCDRSRDGRLLGGHNARRTRLQAAMAEQDEGSREALWQAQHCHRCQCSGNCRVNQTHLPQPFTSHTIYLLIELNVHGIGACRFAGRNLPDTLKWSWRRWSWEMDSMWWILRRPLRWWTRTQYASPPFWAPLSMESSKMLSSWIISLKRRTRRLGKLMIYILSDIIVWG